MSRLGFTKLPLGNKMAIIAMVVGILISAVGRIPVSSSTMMYTQGFDETGTAIMPTWTGHISFLGLDISTTPETADMFVLVISFLSTLGIALFMLGMAYSLRSFEGVRSVKGSLNYYLIVTGAAVLAMSPIPLLYSYYLGPVEADVFYYLFYIGLLICLVGSLLAFRAASMGRTWAGVDLVIAASICSIASFLILGLTHLADTFYGDVLSMMLIVYLVGNVLFFIGLMLGWKVVQSKIYNEQGSIRFILVVALIALLVWTVLSFADFGQLYGFLPVRNEDYPALESAARCAEIIGTTAALSFCAYLGIRDMGDKVADIAPGARA